MSKISPTSDLAVKKVLASEENKDILAGLTNDFFEFEPKDIIIKNPYSIKVYTELMGNNEIEKLRQTLRDIGASFVTSDFLSEIQVRKVRYFDARSLMYPCEIFCQGYNTKTDNSRYAGLKPVYSLNILGYNHFVEDNDALRIFQLYDPVRNKEFKEKYLNIAFFELKKKNIETENQRHWRDYFTTGIVEPGAPSYIRKASEIIDFVNLKKEERDMLAVYEKAQATFEAELDYAHFEGMAEGREEGIVIGENRGIDTSKQVFLMLKNKKDIYDIHNITNMPIEEIQSFMDLLND
jgi:predicted transposase/invertase (TIGR01784 family)